MRLVISLFCLALTASQLLAESVSELLHFDHLGTQRSYYIHLPAAHDGPMPLFVLLHGMGGSAEKLRYGLGFNERANQQGFAVLYPQGQPLADSSSHWNAGLPFSKVDDTGFLSDLIAHVVKAQGLNARQVFVIGISNGGFMAYHLACSGRIELAGIASVIGTMSARDWNNCRPRGSVDLLHIHGVHDPLVPYRGGQSWTEPRVTLHPVPEVVRFWASGLPDMAALTDQRPLHLDGISDPERLGITSYTAHHSNRRAALITIAGFGHDWPFVEQTGLSTTDAIVGFFLKKPRPDDINERQARLAKPLEPRRAAHQR